MNSSLVTCAALANAASTAALSPMRPGVALVVRRDVVQRRRALLRRLGRIDHRGQHVVVDLDQLGGVARRVLRLGDHYRDVVADVARLALRERRVRRLLHRLAVGAGDQPAAGQPADLAGGEVLAGVDRQHAGRLERLVLLDRLDLGVRVRRAHERGVGLPGQGDVVGVLPGAGEEAVVLFALDPSADQGCGHGWVSWFYLAAAMALEPAMIALTMLW